VLRGAKAMRYFMITTFSDLILRVVISYILFPSMNEQGIWLSWPIGWVIGAFLSILFYFLGVWNKNETKASELRA
jgi:Na+-driven multidrug efflux pump